MRRPGRRLWLWNLSLVLVAATLFHPTWTLPRPVHRYLFVLDITQSMNARDYHLPGLPQDRLGFAKAALEESLFSLSCGNEAGLAVFAHKNVHSLIAPLEVCSHGSSLRDTLRAVDWRSAWAGDSHIAHGIFDALRAAAEFDAALGFFSDGQQMPSGVREPAFKRQPAKVNGWIFGVGGLTPVPIPKLDLEGRLTGYWQTTNLPRQILSPRFRNSTPPPRKTGLLLSRLEENRLRRLATETGLDYHRLITPQALAAILKQPRAGQIHPVAVDLRPWIGLAALFLAIVSLV